MMTLFASPKRVLLLLILIFTAQSSAFAHACLWSMAQDKMHPQFYVQSESVDESPGKSCHEALDTLSDAPVSDLPTHSDAGSDCSCASGGCATAASMPAGDYEPVLLINSSVYLPVHQSVLPPAPANLLRPPSIA